MQLDNKTISYSIEWKCIIIPYLFLNLLNLSGLLIGIDMITINRGVCLLINCNIFLLKGLKATLFFLLFFSNFIFLFTKYKKTSSLLIALLAFIILSLEESYGVQSRTGITVFIWLSIFFAYFIYGKNKNKFGLYENRVKLPIQVILACYTLAGISKLQTTGLSWIYSAKLMPLQIVKSNQTNFIDKMYFGEIINNKVEFIMQNETLVIILLAGALLIELTSGLGMINKKMRLLYAFLLLSMHIGIYYLFQIAITPFIVPLVLFMINPLYWVCKICIRLRLAIQ
ncbi:MAG: hypothetical protein M9888_06005 [Chitinophagales bacterium]|nr:hypothetical protein [Chitinophagales bacterium]